MDLLDSDSDDILGPVKIPSWRRNDESDDETWSPRRRSSNKVKKSKRKLKKKSSKSAILKGVPPTRYPKVPKDHFFVLPPELRNRVYEMVLLHDTPNPSAKNRGARMPNEHAVRARGPDGFGAVHYRLEWDRDELAPRWRKNDRPIAVPGVKYVMNGDTKEPALLWVCKQMRDETREMYNNTSTFKLVASPDEFEGMRQWLDALKEKYGRESNDFTVFRSFTLCVHSVDWADIGSLLPLAQIVRNHPIDWDKTIEWHGNHKGNVAKVVQGVINLGWQAMKEDWHPDWLGFKFEEWLETKLDDKIVMRGIKKGMNRYDLEESGGIEPLRKGLPGDWYATEEYDEDDNDPAGFSPTSRARIPSSNRVTRSQKRAEAEQTEP